MSVFSTLFSPFSRWKENSNQSERNHISNEELQSFDKVETVSLEGIDEIYISSNANVIVSATTQKEARVRIHGTTSSNYLLDAFVTQIDKTLRVRAKRNDSNAADSEKGKNKTVNEENEGDESKFANNTFVNITLEIEIPVDFNWRKIKVKNSNGEIILKAKVSADEIEVLNKNGNISISSTFKDLAVDSKQGDIQIKANAVSDMNVTISCYNGTVHLNVANMKNSYLKFQVEGGTLIQPNYDGEYNIHGVVRINNGYLFFS